MPYALCPMPYALCPMPYALCPMPYIKRAPHLTEKGYMYSYPMSRQTFCYLCKAWTISSFKAIKYLKFWPGELLFAAPTKLFLTPQRLNQFFLGNLLSGNNH